KFSDFCFSPLELYFPTLLINVVQTIKGGGILVKGALPSCRSHDGSICFTITRIKQLLYNHFSNTSFCDSTQNCPDIGVKQVAHNVVKEFGLERVLYDLVFRTWNQVISSALI